MIAKGNFRVEDINILSEMINGFGHYWHQARFPTFPSNDNVGRFTFEVDVT
jgi:hypothetical protein